MPKLRLPALNRALLDRQWLLERRPASALEAVTHLVGMQSQAPLAPYTGLWTRLVDFDPSELVDLMTARSVVRLSVMRGTIHLVTASDALGIYPLLQDVHRRMLASNQTLAPLQATIDFDELATAGHRLLSASPLDSASLGTALAAEFPGHDPAALSRAARDLVDGVQIPPRGLWRKGGQPITTTLESWLKQPFAGYTPETLVLRYLAAFGPATPLDMQKWSGLTHLTEIFERLRTGLRTYRLEGSDRELYDLPELPLPDPDSPAPIRFLPAFDNLYLSHADRTRILSADARAQIFTKNGIIKPTVLHDGLPVATYAVSKAHLTITPIAAIPRSAGHAIEAEANALLTFLAPGSDPTVEFLKPA